MQQKVCAENPNRKTRTSHKKAFKILVSLTRLRKKRKERKKLRDAINVRG